MSSQDIKLQVLKTRFFNDLCDRMMRSHAIGGMPAAMRRKLENSIEKAFEVAIKFMNSTTLHEGFLRMLRMNHADLTLEDLVVVYGTSLFPEDTVRQAKWRLLEGQKKVDEN